MNTVFIALYSFPFDMLPCLYKLENLDIQSEQSKRKADHVSKWDQASPTVRTVMAVADYLGTTVSDLLKAPEKGMSP